MSLVNITDFDVERHLLGLYEREVMRTGLSREVCQEEIREENGRAIQWQSG
ncbi:MAG: hypothetical protein RLZZ568_1717 [Cyanobacteriota bacterium]|jgi:hypothetical protein